MSLAQSPGFEVLLYQYGGELYNEDMESLDVARHPDNIYYLYLDTEFEISEYSMIKIVRRKSHE